MTWVDEVDDIVDSLLATHLETSEEQIAAQFQLAAEDEVSWLQSLGLAGPTTPEYSEGDWVGRLQERVVDRVRAYDEAFREAVTDGTQRDDGPHEALERVFSDDPLDGVVIDQRGWLEPTKRVDPDGSAKMQSREIDYLWIASPNGYFDWLASIVLVEARNAGRVAVHRELSGVEGQVWVDPLDEETTPMAARLTGTVWEPGEMPFLPPITHQGRSRIVPMFETTVVGWDQDEWLDELDQRRETWFAQYHQMRQGELDEESFTESDVGPGDVDVSTEVIYQRYLPRNVAQYLPTNAE